MYNTVAEESTNGNECTLQKFHIAKHKHTDSQASSSTTRHPEESTETGIAIKCGTDQFVLLQVESL